MKLILASWLAIAVVATPPAVLRVGPTQTFATIAQAVAAAAPGDLILVDPGIYPAFSVVQPVTIAASGNSFTVTQAVGVAAITITGASGTVAIDGARIDLLQTDSPAIDVSGCTGDVRLQNIVVDAATDFVTTTARAAIEVAGCAYVVLENVDVAGAVARSGATSNPDGQNDGLSAVRFADTQFVLNGCQLVGYDAVIGGGFGGDAVRVVTSGVLQPHSCWLLGTLGNQALTGGAASGNGGNCFHRIGTAPVQVQLCINHFLVPGAGGALAGGTYAINNDGGMVAVGIGRMIPACLGVQVVTTTAPAVVTAGTTFQLAVADFNGGAACIPVLSFGGGYVHALPGIVGRILVDVTTMVQVGVGTTPATFSLTIPNVLGLEGIQLTAQSLVFSPGGTSSVVTSMPALISVR